MKCLPFWSSRKIVYFDISQTFADNYRKIRIPLACLYSARLTGCRTKTGSDSAVHLTLDISLLIVFKLVPFQKWFSFLWLNFHAFWLQHTDDVPFFFWSFFRQKFLQKCFELLIICVFEWAMNIKNTYFDELLSKKGCPFL